MINIEQLISKKLKTLWLKFNDCEFAQIPPLTVDTIPQNAIVFIGLNPSLSKESKDEIMRAKDEIKITYSHGNSKEDTYKYFHKFIEIAKETNQQWGHIDLLYIRETNQKRIEDLFKNKQSLDFIYEQLLISKLVIDKIIDKGNPKIFIVNNALSRRFLGKDKLNNKNIWLDLDFTWDSKIGTYRYKNIPFYFTSMLTGQRALDLGSYERLIWQIKLVTDAI